jgi:hypothetical protein
MLYNCNGLAATITKAIHLAFSMWLVLLQISAAVREELEDLDEIRELPDILVSKGGP